MDSDHHKLARQVLPDITCRPDAGQGSTASEARTILELASKDGCEPGTSVLWHNRSRSPALRAHPTAAHGFGTWTSEKLEEIGERWM